MRFEQVQRFILAKKIFTFKGTKVKISVTVDDFKKD